MENQWTYDQVGPTVYMLCRR